ncbi:MFS transporter [Leucobacter tenebrionis]|uniref:MFS transporter n=1 Tax=Leucobacter tenebrionis TaxID=2873270 RepID=UPI001CA7A833|nr:MFS transporter [Leucobacter tenebrionis]QZY51314.1 MFS transporter [Leucobacter tenebrionis]
MAVQASPRTQGTTMRWWALMVAIAAVLVDMIDNQIVTVALPTIQRELGALDAGLQWISAGYALGFALTLITGARLGDRFGYTRLFVAGMSVFAVASLAAGVAPTSEILIAARVVQGVGSGLMVPQVLSFIHTGFQGAEQAKAMSFYAAAFPLGGLAGPMLGGILTQADLFGTGWRAVFLVNVPIGVIAVIGALITMPRHAVTRRRGLDLSGLLLLTLALLAALFPIVQGRELGWPWWAIALMLASIPLFALFLTAQRSSARRGAEPLIDPTLLRSTSLLAVQAVLFVVNASVAVFFVLTLHLQETLGYTPLQAALTFVPATVGIVAGNVLAFRLTARLGRVLPAAGVTCTLASLTVIAVLALLLGRDLSGWTILVPALVFGAGMGAALNSLFASYMAHTSPEQAGSASGILNTTIQLGTATGIALFGTLYFTAVGQGSETATAYSLLAAAALLAVGLALTPATPKATTATPATATPDTTVQAHEGVR